MDFTYSELIADYQPLKLHLNRRIDFADNSRNPAHSRAFPCCRHAAPVVEIEAPALNSQSEFASPQGVQVEPLDGSA